MPPRVPGNARQRKCQSGSSLVDLTLARCLARKDLGSGVELHHLLHGEEPVEIPRFDDAIERAGTLVQIRDVMACALVIDCQQEGPATDRAVDRQPERSRMV